MKSECTNCKDERARFEAEKNRLLLLHAQEDEDQRREITNLVGEIERQKVEIDRAREEREALKLSFANEIDKLLGQQSISEQRMQERFREIAGISRLLQERDRIVADGQEQLDWLRRVAAVLTMGHAKSLKARLSGWLPTFVTNRRQKALLKRKRLFDPEAYLAANPDVSGANTDALRHYVNHGMPEGRAIGWDREHRARG